MMDVFTALLDPTIDRIDIEKIRAISFTQGLPDDFGIRQICYKMFSNYISTETKSLWENQLHEKRTLYFDYLEDFVKRSDDGGFLEQIDKDVRRTLPDMSFFQQEVQLSPSNPLNPTKEMSRYMASRRLFNRLDESEAETIGVRQHHRESSIAKIHSGFSLGVDCHWEVIVRILFVYSNLNPGIGYVQGMNEILGPLYYIMAQDARHKERDFAEADSFWVFFGLVSELKDHFIRSMDNDKNNGINASMEKLMKLLEKVDNSLYRNLVEKEIHPAYFSLRWLSVLTAREFELPDVLRIWDTLFADKKRYYFLLCFCCSMLICVRDEIIEGDFPKNLSTLQNYPLQDVQQILDRAYIIYEDLEQPRNTTSTTDQPRRLQISVPGFKVRLSSNPSPRSPGLVQLQQAFTNLMQTNKKK